MRNHYELMRNSFGNVVSGGSRNLKKSEIDACYEWRIANIIIKDTVVANSQVSYEEWESFALSCRKGSGLSDSNLKRVKNSIGILCRDMMTKSNDMWRCSEERRRYDEALERLNDFFSVGMYSGPSKGTPSKETQ